MATGIGTEIDPVSVIDSMLLNAYGTAYKFAAKSIILSDVGHDFNPPVRELLIYSQEHLVKSVVLDYCCISLHGNCYGGKPALAVASQVGFPYNKDDLSVWAKETLKLTAGLLWTFYVNE